MTSQTCTRMFAHRSKKPALRIWTSGKACLLMQSSFVVRFPSGNIHHKDPVKFCFEDKETAEEWQQALAHRFQTFSTEPKPSSEVEHSAKDSIHVNAQPQADFMADVHTDDKQDSPSGQVENLST